MITIKQRYVNTIYTIEYAEEFEANQGLFVEGIIILKKKLLINKVLYRILCIALRLLVKK